MIILDEYPTLKYKHAVTQAPEKVYKGYKYTNK